MSVRGHEAVEMLTRGKWIIVIYKRLDGAEFQYAKQRWQVQILLKW